MSPFESIKPGDRVTIKTPHGSELTGRAVMFNTKFQTWVLNLGGAHGTPGLGQEHGEGQAWEAGQQVHPDSQDHKRRSPMRDMGLAAVEAGMASKRYNDTIRKETT